MNNELWRVAVPVPLRREFIYRVPRELGSPAPGKRVLVPFGPRRLTGYLIEAVKEDQVNSTYKIKNVKSILDETPVLSESLLDFLRQSAAYYAHPIGEVLKTALPPGIDPTEKRGTLNGPRITPPRQTIISTTETAVLELESMRKRAPKRSDLLKYLIEQGPCSTDALRKVFGSCKTQLDKLLELNLITLENRECALDPIWTNTVEASSEFKLTSEQQTAVDAIIDKVKADTYHGFGLFGITGSGKTEVYLRAIESVRAKGRGALVLVPEISLTPQLVHRYRARFGDDLAVWHSAMNDRERYYQWKMLHSGRVHVAIGVRSAVFAPIDDLGIVIVDEEHDSSFKQERGFYYNARDLALLRASRSKAVAILGSATPALETYRNAAIGKLTWLELTRRATKRNLPEISIIDLRQHRKGPEGQDLVSKPLYDAINETVSRNEQVILFLNRRGFAPALLCTTCGHLQKCESCDVSLTIHRRPEGLQCHYCGARKAIPNRCDECSSTELRPVGSGTQKAEEILSELFPDARIARLDRDVATGHKIESVLDGLRQGEVDILIGTQMVTKGHDFPNVTLVGVLAADVGLHMPDFRAAERTFQLLTQVAGRAGRSEKEGRGFIQTYSANHPAIQLAQTHNYLGFARFEIPQREELGYPPFGRLCALRISSLDSGKVEAASLQLAQLLRDALHKLGSARIEILGPSPAPLPFIQKRHRWRILLRAPRQDLIRALLEPLLPHIEGPPSGVRINVDIDPVSML